MDVWVRMREVRERERDTHARTVHWLMMMMIKPYAEISSRWTIPWKFDMESNIIHIDKLRWVGEGRDLMAKRSLLFLFHHWTWRDGEKNRSIGLMHKAKARNLIFFHLFDSNRSRIWSATHGDPLTNSRASNISCYYE